MQVERNFVGLAASLVIVAGGFCQAGTNSAGAADAPSALLLGANTIADIAQNAAPAVVNIDVSQAVKSSPYSNFGGNGFGFPGMEFFFNGQKMNPKDFGGGGSGGNGSGGGSGGNGNGGGSGGGSPPKSTMERRDTGSGFIVRADGYIVTNAHVVGDAAKIKVTLNDKRTFEGKVVGMDNFSDLAVVKIEATNLPALKMGTSTNLRPGEFAIAIGSPLGYDHTVTLGIISAVGRSVTDINGNINFIQTDAAINPGNSGGPLLNLQGEVIGVNTAIRRNAQNIGFSIPVDVARSVADQLVASGKILRPWLGIQMRELDETFVKSAGIASGTKGVAIVGFVPGSPAQAAGLKALDVIQKIDGKDMSQAKDVKEYVQSRKVSDVLHFLVLRNKTDVQAVPVNVGDYQDLYSKGKQPDEP